MKNAITNYAAPKLDPDLIKSNDQVLKNQKEILDSIRAIKDKLGIISDPVVMDLENPEEEKSKKEKKQKAIMASLKWKSVVSNLVAKKDGD